MDLAILVPSHPLSLSLFLHRCLAVRSIINYLSRQPRRSQSAASASSGFIESPRRISADLSRSVDRNLCVESWLRVEREREGEKVGRGLKGKEEKKKGGGWRLKNWVKICQRSSLEGEGGKLISACHGEDIHKCSSFFDTVFRVYPFIRSLCCFCMSLSLSLSLGWVGDCSATCTTKICLVTLLACAFVNKYFVERCSRRINIPFVD